MLSRLDKEVGKDNLQYLFFTEELPMAKMEQITTKTKIAGYEKEVAQLEQLKDFLHNAEKYANCGVHIPKGVLLYGYPGVGKTVMAKSIADEHINIVELRAADCTRDNSEEFIQEAFAKAKEMKPCLLLIDEFDKIAGCRDEFYMEMNVMLNNLYNYNSSLFVLVKVIIPTIVLGILCLKLKGKISNLTKIFIYTANIVYILLDIYHISLLIQLI